MDMVIEDELIEHDLVQGSDEWLAFRLNHDGASEAAAMLGLSSKTKRSELLHIKHTGMGKEFSDWVQQNILDYGHEVEAMARPIVAKQHGIRLFPMVYSRGRMSASCDGVTMLVDAGWEHKQKNAKLFAAIATGELPDEYMPQPQQCMMVTGAERWIFTVSDGTEDNMVSMEVLPDPVWFERIRAGWAQFHKDLAEYVPPNIVEMPNAESMLALPTLFIQAQGEITPESSKNLVKFSEKTAQYIADRKADLQHLRTSPDVTDQDVANAKARGADCREAVERLKLVKAGVLAQTMTLGDAMDTMDKLQEDYRLVALDLEKEADKAIDAKKLAILSKAKLAYADHATNLEIETKPIRIFVTPPDFALAMKGKKSIKGWQDAVDTALANGKISADTEAKDIIAKLAWCKENAAGLSELFPDLQQIIIKPMDDFTLTITSRVEKHKEANARKAAEIIAKIDAENAAKLEAERTRMQAEEEAKARAKVEAEARAKVAEEAKAQRVLDDLENEILAQQEAAAIEEKRKQAQIADQIKPVRLSGLKTAVAQSITPRRPNRAELLDAVATTFGTTNEAALDWILQEFRGDIQHEERKAA